MPANKRRLGEVLCERGYISTAELTRTLQDQQGKVARLGELILERGLVEKEELVRALSEVTGVPYLDCTKLHVDPSVLGLVPEDFVRRYSAIPVEVNIAGLTVVLAEPQNLKIVADLVFRTGLKINPRLGFHREIERAIDRLYGKRAGLSAALEASDQTTGIEFISSSAQQRNIEAMREIQSELQQTSKTTPAVKVVASMIKDAAAKHASDIHVEPGSAEMLVRFRVDGILRDYRVIPRELQNVVVSRVKILSDMNIAERRAPQDGRFLVRLGDGRIDVRVSTLPTQYGEKVVLRLLESESPMQEFKALGFPEGMSRELKRLLRLPQGMLLVTGPTSSGKSTTLYSSLNLIRRPTINIVTVEDPVEYAIPGLNQVQVNVKAGLTFSSCLRSILRQDPNVIMIGEIRDKETADIAMKAAQTGHLVLSTVHTNDSISAITRLLDIGVAPFQIANSLTAVIAQRLVRRLCTCYTSRPGSDEYRAQMLSAGGEPADADTENVPQGCDRCDSTGFRGRIGVFEMLLVDDRIRLAIRNGSRNEEICALAKENGLRLMQEEGLNQVRQGLTTLDEVQRVVLFEKISAVACAACQRELLAQFAFCPFCGEKRPNVRASHPLRELGADPRQEVMNP